jgi:hypothetical protein
MKRIYTILLLGSLLPGIVSCKRNDKREEARRVVAEWTGKTIRFPENHDCNLLGSEAPLASCASLFEKEYKVLLYVDSTGCTSCKLRLFEWGQLIREADSLFAGRLGFLFFFQPRDKRELQLLLKQDYLDYPVFMDTPGALDQLNHLPGKDEYRCFLLDGENKVVALGNPTFNRKIWELYKKKLSGERGETGEKMTTVTIKTPAFDFGHIRLNTRSDAVFPVKNTGDVPFLVRHVSTSCGCTVVEWEKKPVLPGETMNIKVGMTPDETGYFSKTIKVYGNVNESFINLTIHGTVSE